MFLDASSHLARIGRVAPDSADLLDKAISVVWDCSFCSLGHVAWNTRLIDY